MSRRYTTSGTARIANCSTFQAWQRNAHLQCAHTPSCRTFSVAAERSLPSCFVSPLILRPRMSKRLRLLSRSNRLGGGSGGPRSPPRAPEGALRFLPLAMLAAEGSSGWPAAEQREGREEA